MNEKNVKIIMPLTKIFSEDQTGDLVETQIYGNLKLAEAKREIPENNRYRSKLNYEKEIFITEQQANEILN